MTTKKEYLETGYSHCLYCGSDNLNASGTWEGSENQVYQNIVCRKCKKEWTDIYTLTDVETLEGEPIQ